MKSHLLRLLLTLLPLTAAFSDAETNYVNKTLIPRVQPFVGSYYYENGSTEKLLYGVFTGPSPELAAKLELFPESSSNFDAIHGNILWGHVTLWSSLALVPVIGEAASGAFFTEAKNLTDLDVWNYNRRITFESHP